MHIRLISVGRHTPAWVNDGFHEYAKRLPPPWRLELNEIALGKRGKHADIKRLQKTEGEKTLAAVPRDAVVIALDENGRQWNSRELANHLQTWQQHTPALALLIGGPEGLAPACKQRATQLWSLSQLTLPHQLVRVVVAEQIYRAWSLLNQHPYHRD